MSIRSISSTSPGLGYGQPPPGGPGGRRPVGDDPSGLSILTWEDRELAMAVYGPDVLNTGRVGEGDQIGVPPFVWRLTDDRRSGRLPLGSEVTRGYLQAIWAGQSPGAGPPTLTDPLTERTLAAALEFLGRRGQGATVDVRA